MLYKAQLKAFLGSRKHVFNRVNNTPLEKERVEVWLSGSVPCVRPWAPSPALKKKEKKRCTTWLVSFYLFIS